MNRLRGFVTVLLIAGLVGSGIAYHLNVVKEYDTTLTVVATQAADATLENYTLATENLQLQSGTDDLLLITKRAFVIAEAFSEAGVTSYEEVDEILNQVIDFRADLVMAGKQVPPIVDNLVDLLKRVRDRLLDVFVEPLEIPDVPDDPPMPDEDRVASGSSDGDLYAGRYHTRKRTSRFFKRARRVG